MDWDIFAIVMTIIAVYGGGIGVTWALLPSRLTEADNKDPAMVAAAVWPVSLPTIMAYHATVSLGYAVHALVRRLQRPKLPRAKVEPRR